MSTAANLPAPRRLLREPEVASVNDQQRARALGLTSATGLVIGTIIGTGVFTMRPCWRRGHQLADRPGGDRGRRGSYQGQSERNIPRRRQPARRP